MSSSLVMLAPRIGGASETFIARHVNGLWAPSQTTVISRERVEPSGWEAMPEVAYLGGARRLVPHGSLRWRAVRLLPAGRRESGPTRPAAAHRDALAHALAGSPDASVLAQYLDVWATLLVSGVAAGRPTVVRAHGYDVSTRLRSSSWRAAYRELTDHAVIAACSEYSRGLLVAAGLDPGRVVCVPNSVDIAQFAARLEARVRSADDRLIVLSVGRLVEKKDPSTTIRAIAQLNERGLRTALTIVGTGPLEGRLRRLVRELGVEDHVDLVGPQSHASVRERLRRCDAFVQHSKTAANGDEEGMPISVIEAMASSLPVVATRHAGMTELLSDGSGWLVEPGDSDGIVRALETIASNPEEANVRRRQARERAEKHYAWEVERDKLRQLLELG